MVLLVLSFLSSQVVDGVNNGVSELVQGIDDLSEDILVGEVLVGGQGDQSLDHGGHSGARADLGLDVLEGVLEALDLEEGRVGEGL